MQIAALWKLVHLRREQALCSGTVVQQVPLSERLPRGLFVGDIGAARLPCEAATRGRWPALLEPMPLLGVGCLDRMPAHRLR